MRGSSIRRCCAGSCSSWSCGRWAENGRRGRSSASSAPASLAEVNRLTPGDFAVVARQLRHDPAAHAREIVERLRREVAAKPEAAGRLGF
jgi:hypothetical protein